MTQGIEELELHHQFVQANHPDAEHVCAVEEMTVPNGSVESQIDEQQSTSQVANESFNNGEHRALVPAISQKTLPEELGKAWCFLIFAAMTFYILDVISDLYVSYDLYVSGMVGYFMWTLMFVVASSLITNLLSLFFYLETRSNLSAPKVSPTEWAIRAVVLVCQLGPVLRYIDTYRYGRKAKTGTEGQEQNKMYVAMTYERADVALIRLLECFIEAAPQMVLQIYIMVDSDLSTTSLIVKFVSCAISLVSLSLSIMSQQRAMRASQENSVLMTWPASFIQFSSYACLILPRVVTFGLFASYSLTALLFICIIHCAIMTTWIFHMKTELAENRFIETIFKFLFGIAYVFCYINLESTPTRFRLTAFHLLTFIENVGMIIAWSFGFETNCKYFIVSLVICSYIVGLLLLVAYYKIFHPNKENIEGITFCWPLPSEECEK